MRTMPIHRQVSAVVAAIVPLILLSPVLSGSQPDNNRPIHISFTKWVTAFPLMEGFTDGDVVGAYAGEVLQRQVSVNPNLNGIVRLEAIYEVQAGDHTFTALIRGGTDALTGKAILDGVVLAGWRVGAPVHVEFDTIPANTGCAGAPPNTTCFQGTIDVGRAPKAKN
jgi:hypothetical protein